MFKGKVGLNSQLTLNWKLQWASYAVKLSGTVKPFLFHFSNHFFLYFGTWLGYVILNYILNCLQSVPKTEYEDYFMSSREKGNVILLKVHIVLLVNCFIYLPAVNTSITMLFVSDGSSAAISAVQKEKKRECEFSHIHWCPCGQETKDKLSQNNTRNFTFIKG